jgi:hypothetical protein
MKSLTVRLYYSNCVVSTVDILKFGQKNIICVNEKKKKGEEKKDKAIPVTGRGGL